MSEGAVTVTFQVTSVNVQNTLKSDPVHPKYPEFKAAIEARPQPLSADADFDKGMLTLETTDVDLIARIRAGARFRVTLLEDE